MKKETKNKIKLFAGASVAKKLIDLEADMGLIAQPAYGVPSTGQSHFIGILGQILVIIVGLVTIIKMRKKGWKKICIALAIFVEIFIAISVALYYLDKYAIV